MRDPFRNSAGWIVFKISRYEITNEVAENDQVIRSILVSLGAILVPPLKPS